MSYLSILVQSLTFRPVHTFVHVDLLRTELCEAGQIPAASLGPLFAEACQKGYLTATPATVKTTWRPGKGRLIRVYQVTAKARNEARRAAELSALPSTRTSVTRHYAYRDAADIARGVDER